MDHEIVDEFYQARLESYLSTLKKWVNCNSQTVNKDGVSSHGRDVALFFSILGFESEFINPSIPEYGPHLVLTRGNLNAPTIGLVSHLDTVFSEEELNRNNFSWRVEAERIYGPGIIDIKGGTLAIFALLDAFLSLEPELFNAVRWVVLLNAAEETNAPDFAEICRAKLALNQSGENNCQSKRAHCALVFEMGPYDAAGFSLVTGRKGRVTGRIFVTGRAAHAGNAPEKGASAIRQLARLIEALESLNDYQNGISVNVGVCSGGTGPNTVASQAELKFEMRSRTREGLTKLIEEVKKIVSNPTVAPVSSPKEVCQIELEIDPSLPVWEPNEDTKKLLRLWQDAAKEMGWKVLEQHRGGGSDGNPLARLVPTIDGLGPPGGNLHCSKQAPEMGLEQEYLSLPSLKPKLILNFFAVRKIIDTLQIESLKTVKQ